MSDDDDRQVRVLGQAARQLLESPAYALILNTLSDSFLKTLIDLPPGDDARPRRDHAHMMIHTLRELNDAVQGHNRALTILEFRASQQDDE